MFNRIATLIFFLIAITIVAVPSFAQVNIGFEKGNFDNWEFAVGKIETNGNVTTYPSIAVPGSFTILKNDQSDFRDPIGNFSVFSPNGSKYSIKLGNDFYDNGVQQISYTLKVPPTGSNSIIFDYAVVLESPGHEPYQQPRFTVRIYNVTDGKYLDCPTFDFIASSKLPGFKLRDTVFYKDWSSAAINLTGLNNKDIRLEFRVNHCPFGAHYGYAYIDVNENIGTPIQGNHYCANQTAITLSAPPGFASYSWFTSDFKKLLGTGQYLTLSTPPSDSTRLAVTVVPYNGLGCADTLYTTVSRDNNAFKFVVKEAIVGCPGSAVDLTDKEITSGSSAGLMLDYLTDSLQVLSSPFNVTNAGLYYIRATNAGGCSNLLPVKITFELPQLKISNPPAVRYPSTVDLSTCFTAQQGILYSYYRDEHATMPLANFTAVPTSGKYYVKAETASGCINVQPVIVTILPPEPFFITVPNAFTPNDDGINDHFAVSLNGQVSFSSLQIYNRNGALIFGTVNATKFWDGTFNGRPVPTGTYYWVFEGYDNYDHMKVNRSSYITLIR